LTQNAILHLTNHAFVYFPVDCATTNVTLYQGMDRIQFVRSSYDSLLGRYYAPITNDYQMVMVTNSTAYTQKLRRVITHPDIIFNAGDDLNAFLARTGTAGWNQVTNGSAGYVGPAGALPAPGPGTIDPSSSPIVITFNRIVPQMIHWYDPTVPGNGLNWESTRASITSMSFTNFGWGTFTDSTNVVVYPDGTSLAALEQQVLFQILTVTLPDGTNNLPYSAQLQATGQPPLSWSLAAGSAPLPVGLVLGADGTISGSPAQQGTFYFTVTVTDATAGAGVPGRTATRTVGLTIH
jgi:hypothetical protein